MLSISESKLTSIQRESYWDSYKGIALLLEAHWEEVALHKDVIPLLPDFTRYQRLETLNRLVVITAREGGVVVGYSVFFLHHHVHYHTCFVANNDVIYLRPDKRGIVGARLVKRSEEILRGLGVQRVTWHVKTGHDWSGMLERLGYVREEIIMGKLLGDSHV